MQRSCFGSCQLLFGHAARVIPQPAFSQLQGVFETTTRGKAGEAHNTFLVDNHNRRVPRDVVVECNAALRVDQQRVARTPVAHKCPDGGFIFIGDANNGNVGCSAFTLELFERSPDWLAGAAPGCPEVDHHNLAGRECIRSLLAELRQRESRCSLACERRGVEPLAQGYLQQLCFAITLVFNRDDCARRVALHFGEKMLRIANRDTVHREYDIACLQAGTFGGRFLHDLLNAHTARCLRVHDAQKRLARFIFATGFLCNQGGRQNCRRQRDAQGQFFGNHSDPQHTAKPARRVV